MIIVAFALMIFFAVKTRSKIDRYGKSNILWDKEHIYNEQPPNVEEWVSIKKHFQSFIKSPGFCL
jgi:occludin